MSIWLSVYLDGLVHRSRSVRDKSGWKRSALQRKKGTQRWRQRRQRLRGCVGVDR
eukprot:COSAG01_NODE_4442_length_5020_cov_4.707377_2_plen_55_part_00